MVKVILSSCLLLLLSACQSHANINNAPSQLNSKAHEVTSTFKAHTFVYQCENNFSFVAHSDNPQKIWLFLPQQTLALTQQISASGIKYTTKDNNNQVITFWQKGQQASLSLNKQHYKNCLNDIHAAIWEQAKLLGADFRAIGQEPGWNITISQENGINYVGDYGQSKLHFNFVKPQQNHQQQSTEYQLHNSNHQLTIKLQAKKCVDSMSGEKFETVTTLILDEKILTGCGRALH